MGLLVEGKWQDSWYDTKSTGGRFVRQDASFRHSLGDGEFPAEPGRYHLYVAYACPWAHRTLIYRALLGLEETIGASAVHPEMLQNGWEFRDEFSEPNESARYLYEIYQRADSAFSGRVTVPVLWDKTTKQIVNNESSELIRMFEDHFGDGRYQFRPEDLRADIDRVNARIYDTVNNGVYKSGFATTQEAYEEAVTALFDSLDWLEKEIEGPYIFGTRLTEADIRLFTTLIRFDAVYYSHFKCSRRRLIEYPKLWALTRRIYQMPEVKPTVRFDQIRHHYFFSHESINPHRVVPIMPDIDYDEAVD